MSARFLIDAARVRQLSATRQGRVSLGGFAYQVGYAVARLASLYTGRPLLDIDGVPTLLRFDWAEDLDEVEGDGRVVLTQCKRISDIGQAGSLADVLLGLAPKWLWTPEDRRSSLRFRLVCTDPRFAGLGPVLLRSHRPRPGESDREAVLAAAVAQLQTPPGARSDRTLWQADAEAFGLSGLCEALWERTEVLYLPSDPIVDDPAGPLFRAESEALALLVRTQAVAPSQQRQALAELRSLLHGNVVEFDPIGARPVPFLDREPRVLGFDEVYYALFELQLPSEERPPFQVVTRQILEQEATKPKQPFVARRPRWADVVHGQDAEIGFLERVATDQLLARIRDELLANLGVGEALPMLFVLGAPGAGKSTLVLRVAARLVQEGLAVVAAPKLNLDRIEPDELEPLLQSLARLEEGSLPVLLVLDDPFFAESGWVDLLRRLAKKSHQVAVLGASPDYLFREFGHEVTTGRQMDCRTFTLPRPPRDERQTLARLHGRDPETFEEREEDFLVLAMEASADTSFDTIIDRVWITLNNGLPIRSSQHPAELPWTVRAYLIACFFQRFYLQCPEVLMRAVLNRSGKDQPPGGFSYELQRLVTEQGWSIFSVAEPEKRQRFLGMRIGASHPRVAADAWRRRPAPAFDVGEWVLQASVEAQAAAMEIGSLAAQLEKKSSNEKGFLSRLTDLWSHAARIGEVETRALCFLHAALSLALPTAARRLHLALETCVARRDGQSWLAALALARESPDAAEEQLGPDSDLLNLIEVADFHLAPNRAGKLMNLVRSRPVAYDAFVARVQETSDHPNAYWLLVQLMVANPRDRVILQRAIGWSEKYSNHPQASWLLSSMVAANPGDDAVLKRALACIDVYPDHPQVPPLLASLVTANPGDDALHQRAIEWSEQYFDHPGVYRLLSSLVTADPGDDALRHRTIEWSERYFDHPNMYQLLSSLVTANPGDDALRQRAIEWSEKYFDHPNMYQLLASLMTANPGDDALRQRAIEWSEKYFDHPGVYRLLSSLVAANPGDDALRQRAIEWSEKYFDHPGAYRLLSSLVAANPGDDALRQQAIKWSEKYFDHPNMYQLLASLVTANPGDDALRQRAIEWSEKHLDHPNMYQLLASLVTASPGDGNIWQLTTAWIAANQNQAYKLLASLLAANPADYDIRQRATAWIEANPNHPQVYLLLAPLVAANPGDDTVRQRATAWIEANPNHPQVYLLLASLVAANPGDDAVRQRATAWIEANPNHFQVCQLLGSLVAANPGDDTVRQRATAWIEANPNHPQVYLLLASLVAANPGDDAVRQRATAWIEANPNHFQVCQLLGSLVAANPEDDAVSELATAWIEVNPKHPQVNQLLAPLVAANSGDEKVYRRATEWIGSNFNHPKAVHLLTTLIARSDGAEDTLQMGEAYLENSRGPGKASILGVLLTAGKAAPRYIDLALDYIDHASQTKAKNFVLHCLSKACATNLSAALAYVAGCADMARKKTMLRRIALGVQRRPQALEGLLNRLSAALSLDDVNALLVQLLDLGIDAESLCQFLAGHMDLNFRTRGYSYLLRAIQRNPAAQAALLAVPDLDPWVREDLLRRVS